MFLNFGQQGVLKLSKYQDESIQTLIAKHVFYNSFVVNSLQINISMIKLSSFLFAAGCIFIFAAFSNIQKATGTIILHDEKFGFAPHEFYVADVIDDRTDRTAVAALIVRNAANLSAIQSADLSGGAAASIKHFLDHNLATNTTSRPIIITIKKFKLTESRSTERQVTGQFTITFSFELQLKYRTVHLTDYSSGIRYTKPDNQPDVAESTLKQGIKGALSWFNSWMDQQAGSNVLLAKGVKVKFTDFTEKPEGDTIYYAANRPLTWDDFKEKPRESRFEAEIFTSIGYTEQTEVANSIINITIALKVEVPKSDCWVKDKNLDAYTLNHEQRHFDIEKLVSEHFKQKILAMDLPVDNFDGPINVEYLETLREANRLQKQYDTETRHGTDRQAQEQWNEKIDRELKTYGVKK